MRVLITGARGFLGASIARQAGAHGLDPIPSSRGEDGGHAACDLADAEALGRLLRQQAPDAVVNCAVIADFAAGALPRQIAVNAIAPGVMAAWAAKTGAHLVQVSSILVHGARISHVSEATTVAPDTDYGRSKALAEELVLGTGCRSTIVRIGGIFGGAGPDHLGLNRSIRAARAGQRPVLIGEGRARRNYIHVDDAAQAVLQAASRGLCGIFRLGGREVLTMAAMLQAVCDVFLPGQSPERKAGAEAPDQIVAMSSELPAGRSFVEALRGEA